MMKRKYQNVSGYPKLLLTGIVVFFLSFGATSQVKIGDNPTTINGNSLLELENDAKGVLIPRVTLDDASTAAPLTAPIPEGMMIYNDSGSVEKGFYYWTGTEWSQLLTGENSTARDNHVLVKSVSDLPAASGGIITLAANTVYEINGSIVLSDQIDPNGSYIVGVDASNDRLIFTGSGALFAGSNGVSVKTLTLAAITGGSQVFNLNDASGTKSVLIRDCYIANTVDIGLIKGFNIVFGSVISFTGNFSGITYEDINNLLLENMAWFSDNSGTFETYVGTFGVIEKLGGFMSPMAANSATGVDVTGIVSVGNADYKNSAFTGDGTRVSGTFSKNWEVATTGIDTETDDVASGNIYISSTTLTDIITVNTPVKVSGTTTSSNLFRFTGAVSNRLVYDGTKTRNFKIIASVSMTASANNKDFSFYLAKNGSVVTSTRQRIKIASGSDIGSLTLNGLVELASGDYIEVWVENNTDNTDITIQNMNLSVN